VLLLLSGCSKGRHENQVQFYFGECRLEVVSKTEGAEIDVDGVPVSHHESEVKLDVPCGEKRIDVVKEGYIPFHKFFPVDKGAPVKITVELEKSKPLKNEALSAELIDSLRVKTVAKVETGDAAQAGADGAAGAASEKDTDNVDDWR
jgi:hypothetical protein